MGETTEFYIKSKFFTFEKMGIKNMDKFLDGSVAICRLAPNDYHHFHMPVDGKIVSIDEKPSYGPISQPVARSVVTNADYYPFNFNKIVNLTIDTGKNGLLIFSIIGAIGVDTILLDKGIKKGKKLSKG